ncbi:MAG: chromate efflux transporter [Bacteroidetes bacterium]|nr:chromate efflux transporter [Bacteroidota bacterium]MCL6101134.1 chromate efflux transporter [Bacteroidota bacterium]
MVHFQIQAIGPEGRIAQLKVIRMEENKKVSLKYLFFTFLKIGTISWGGFMALIAVVQKQLVDKDKVIKEELILDGISLASVLPGAVAINVVTYIGYQLRGIKGALVSLVATVFPGFLLVLGLGVLYTTYGELALLNKFFLGILPAIASVILSVAIEMAGKQIKDVKQIAICVLAAFCLLTIHSFFATLISIIFSAIAGYFLYKIPAVKAEKANVKRFNSNYPKLIFYTGALLAIVLLIFLTVRLLKIDAYNWYQLNRTIFLTFSGMSLTLFGGGYVIIPAMQQVIVDGFHWMTTKEFADAIAMGQITPGPVILTATFIGYRVAGFMGACVATFAIFFPPGLVMLMFSGFLKKIKDSNIITAIFKGMRPAIIGMIFSAAFTVGKGAEMGWISALIFLVVLVLLVKFKMNVLYMIPLAGIAGMLFF